MEIRQVTLVSGTETPVGEGASLPVRAIVRFEDTSSAAAILKTLNLEGYTAEIFCSVLCRMWGLNVPEIALVKNKPLTLASIDTTYPNLKQSIGWSEQLPDVLKNLLQIKGSALVSSFPSTPTALAIDEAINNRDRNFGNILWDGTDVAWIDHERSLGFGNLDDRNKLVDMAVLSDNADRLQSAAVAISLALTADVIKNTHETLEGLDKVEDYVRFTEARIKKLTALIVDRFPKPNDLFNVAQQ
jgi:hypothetical protein